MDTLLLLAAIAAIIFSTILSIQTVRNDPEKIFGVYSQPGKWYCLKYWCFRLLILITRLKYYVFGRSYFYKSEQLEKPQPLSSHPLAFDAVFFQAVSSDGFYFCGGTERRHEAKSNGLFYIVDPEHGLLASEKLPNTMLDTDPESVLKQKNYSAEGITFTPIEPMKTWTVSYRGNMKCQNNPNKTVSVELEGTWTSDLPWILFEVDLSSKAIASAIAREPWSRDLFKALEEAHQTHYEQMGYFNGVLRIDGVEKTLFIDAFRDHSFGHKRDWKLMHRYIFHMFYLSDGTKICLGVICQPSTSSHLTLGYVVHPDKSFEAIEETDLKLYQHAEAGDPPKELWFVFETELRSYEVKVKYEHTAVHYVGNNVEAKMYERFHVCEINGVKGRGISEWHYNNVKNE